jgi:hypothetical protein
MVVILAPNDGVTPTLTCCFQVSTIVTFDIIGEAMLTQD